MTAGGQKVRYELCECRFVVPEHRTLHRDTGAVALDPSKARREVRDMLNPDRTPTLMDRPGPGILRRHPKKEPGPTNDGGNLAGRACRFPPRSDTDGLDVEPN